MYGLQATDNNFTIVEATGQEAIKMHVLTVSISLFCLVSHAKT